MTTPLRVGVIGGSIGGLTAAVLLRDLGHDVRVFERSSGALSGFGAGIVAHPATTRYFRERGGLSIDEVALALRLRRYVDGTGAIVHEEPSVDVFTSWGVIYRHLLESFGEDRYHRGEALVGLDQDDDGVDVRFASGRDDRFDFLVCADGIGSTARRRLFPRLEPRYAGYVGWRCVLDERRLSPAAFEELHEAIVYQLVGLSHVLAYPIPGQDGETRVGERLMNLVWYRSVPEQQLEEFMTDRDGIHRAISLPPGTVQERYVRTLREDAEADLAPALAEIVLRADEPFVQALADVEVPRMAVGRVCIIGDAAFAGRPHAAAGSAKAAENAWRLAEALEASGGDLPAALRAWEPSQVELGRRLVARTREMGERCLVFGTWVPGDPELRFGLYGPGM